MTRTELASVDPLWIAANRVWLLDQGEDIDMTSRRAFDELHAALIAATPIEGDPDFDATAPDYRLASVDLALAKAAEVVLDGLERSDYTIVRRADLEALLTDLQWWYDHLSGKAAQLYGLPRMDVTSNLLARLTPEPEYEPDAMDYTIGNTAGGHEHWDIG